MKSTDKNKIEENSSVSNVNGMGNISLPDGDSPGSGDIPFSLGATGATSKLKSFDGFTKEIKNKKNTK